MLRNLARPKRPGLARAGRQVAYHLQKVDSFPLRGSCVIAGLRPVLRPLQRAICTLCRALALPNKPKDITNGSTS